MTLRTVLVDGLSVETTDAGAQAITKLLADVARTQGLLNDANTVHSQAIAAKDADLSKVQAKLDDALGKVLTADQISALVADRVALEAKAVQIAKDVKPTGLTDAALKLAVVKAALGDKLPADRVADASYIDARFDILAEDAGKAVDTFRDARTHQAPPGRQPSTAVLTDAQKVRQQAFDDLLHFDQTGTERQAAN